ncbi:MAG: hypothetical protein AB7N76_08305 [Planctomycetota bacterium]
MAPRSLPPWLLLLSCLLAGCASDPVVAVDQPATGSGELQVVVWWEKGQAPVGARGKVTSLSSLESVPFDTRGRAVEGQVLSLSPGRYSVSVEHRYQETGPAHGLQAVSGERVVYVEPGVRTTVTVTVTDREGDMGCARRLLGSPRAGQALIRPLVGRPTPKESALPLPLEPSSG